MNFDNIIKESLEDSVDNLDLSVEKYEDMFNYITEKSELKKQSFISRLLQGINALFRGFNCKDALGIAAFVMVLILIPTAVNYSKGKTGIGVVDTDSVNNTDKIIKDYDFSDDLEKFISDLSTRNKQEGLNFKMYSKIDEIKEKSLFPVEIPTYIPEGYKLFSSQLVIDELEVFYPICQVQLIYRMTNDKEIIFNQITDIDIYKDIVKNYEKISINGVDAWVEESKGDNKYTNIVFVKGGKDYRISSMSVGREKLIKMAESLDFSLKEDTRLKYIKGSLTYFKDIDKIKANVPFVIDYPQYLPTEYKKEDTILIKRTVDKSSMYMINIPFMGKKDESINVLQTNDKGKPEKILKKSEKIKINELDAWFYERLGDPNPIPLVMFWKNGKFYIVSGTKITKDELIKIAQSL